MGEKFKRNKAAGRRRHCGTEASQGTISSPPTLLSPSHTSVLAASADTLGSSCSAADAYDEDREPEEAIHADLKAAVEVETHAYLWTPSDGVDFIPRVCDKIFGDGRALLRLTTINSRPRFYVIRIDSAWKVDDSGAPDGGPDIWDHLEEIYEALEEQFGRVREIEDDEINGWPAFDHETGASWSRMDWPELPGVRLEPHPYAGHFTILGDEALQHERSALVRVLSAWRVEKTGEEGCE